MKPRADEHAEIFTKLFRETVACTPPDWDHGTLTIESVGQRLNCRLENADRSSTAVISGSLHGLIGQLHTRRDRGDTWTRIVISFRREGDCVRFDTRFVYAAAERSPAKPWWKFGASQSA